MCISDKILGWIKELQSQLLRWGCNTCFTLRLFCTLGLLNDSWSWISQVMNNKRITIEVTLPQKLFAMIVLRSESQLSWLGAVSLCLTPVSWLHCLAAHRRSLSLSWPCLGSHPSLARPGAVWWNTARSCIDPGYTDTLDIRHRTNSQGKKRST